MRALSCFVDAGQGPEAPVYLVSRGGFEAWLAGQSEAVAGFVRGAGFTADSGKTLPLPGDRGIAGFLAGRDGKDDCTWAGTLASALPEGAYRLEGVTGEELSRAALAWALGAYQFTAYKAAKRAPARLALPRSVFSPELTAAAEAAYLVRDLVNMPTSELGTAELEAAARTVAERHGASVDAVVGDALLDHGLRLIHAVGRAAANLPRLIDLSWGGTGDPKVTLVGKGVVFDSGGLDIKPSSSMLLMKKDMGGAAHVLGLAHMIMSAKLPVRLRVLIPAVENAVGGEAFRPGDIIRSHKGLTVEIGDTDAEGRLVLADALSVADAEAPELIVDMATLTGAARAALGPELPALFSTDDKLAADLMAASEAEADPMWRMPLWQPYAKWLESPVADLNNTSKLGFAGAIVAALFLKRFVEKAKAWVHLDIYAWAAANTGTRSVGGEAQCLRALYRVIKTRYG